MTNGKRWLGRAGIVALVTGAALLTGCFHPHYYAHHGGRHGVYGYDDHDRGHGHHRRHKRHHRHHRWCNH